MKQVKNKMLCPNCGKELNPTDGKYHCLDCGFQEKQANLKNF